MLGHGQIPDLSSAENKHTWGFHPVLASCDNTNEALTGMLRPGNAGSNTAADHIAVIDAALAQIPAEHRHGYPILFRFDGAGASKALLGHLRGLRDQGVDAEFTVGWAVTAREHAAIAELPEIAWTPAIDTDGDPRDGAAVVELTGMSAAGALRDYPEGMRVIARRERPHPGAQLDLIEERDGWRYTCFATDTRLGQHAWLDARHRSHARVEDRIRCGKDTGIGRFPSKLFTINAAWLACALTAIDLLAWTQTMLVHDQPELARANPRRRATCCCTSLPDSSAADAVYGSRSTAPGAGPRTSPPPSSESKHCPHRRPEPTPRHPETPRTTREPNPGNRLRPNPDHQNRTSTRSPKFNLAAHLNKQG